MFDRSQNKRLGTNYALLQFLPWLVFDLEKVSPKVDSIYFQNSVNVTGINKFVSRMKGFCRIFTILPETCQHRPQVVNLCVVTLQFTKISAKITPS